MFKVNNKNTRTTSTTNFKYVSRAGIYQSPKFLFRMSYRGVLNPSQLPRMESFAKIVKGFLSLIFLVLKLPGRLLLSIIAMIKARDFSHLWSPGNFPNNVNAKKS